MQWREVTIVCTDPDHPTHAGLLDFEKVTHCVDAGNGVVEVLLVNGTTVVIMDTIENLLAAPSLGR